MGQPSSIDLLPQEAREALHAWLRDPAITQLEATSRTNALLEEIGVDHRVTKSAVNRYSIKMEDVGARLRQAREVSEMWIANLGSQPQGQLGKLLNEIVRTMAFETTMAAADSGKPLPPKMIKDLALAIQRLESAANMNEEREKKIRDEERTRAAEAAAQAIEKKGKTAGVSKDGIAAMQAAIMQELSA